MSYGPNLADLFRPRRYLRGQNSQRRQTRDLPVEQPTKFELNLKAAKALGFEVPSLLIAKANELIE